MRTRLGIVSLWVASLVLAPGCSSEQAGLDADVDAARLDGAVGHDAGIDAATSDDAATEDAATDDAGLDASSSTLDANPPDAFASDAATSVDAGMDANTNDANTNDAATNDANLPLPLNGCTRATAMDLTGVSTTTIDFPVAGLNYSPRCIRVRVGTQVTFAGSFAFHPLQAGTVSGTVTTPQTSGTPLPTTALSTGTTATFAMTPAGAYGYYCMAHGGFGMNGAIYVE